jgi:NADPH:quinone reductase-like Zn-dependent oxidoreductase
MQLLALKLVLVASFLLVHCIEKNMECGESQNMKVVQIQNPEMMFIDTFPKVILRSEKDVLIQVKAAGVNRADVLQRKGMSLFLLAILQCCTFNY